MATAKRPTARPTRRARQRSAPAATSRSSTPPDAPTRQQAGSVKDRSDSIREAAAAIKAARKTRPQRRHGGPPAKRQAIADGKRIVDRSRVLQLRLDMGLSFRQVGQQLGMSDVQAMRLYYEALGTYVVDDAKTVPLLRAQEDARLDQTYRAMLPLQHGQLPSKTRVVGRGRSRKVEVVPHDPIEVARLQTVAAQRIIAVGARRAALHGLDAPLKVTATDPTGARRYDDLSDDDLERALSERIAQARQVGAVLPATVVANGKEDAQ